MFRRPAILRQQRERFAGFSSTIHRVVRDTEVRGNGTYDKFFAAKRAGMPDSFAAGAVGLAVGGGRFRLLLLDVDPVSVPGSSRP